MSYNASWNKWIIASVIKHFKAKIAASTISDSVIAAVDNTGGYAIGSKVITIDGTTGDSIAVDQWCTIAGDPEPRQIVAVAGTPTTQITLDSGLNSAVADNAVITIWTSSIGIFIEGTSSRDLSKSEYIEIRVDGPYVDERTKDDFMLKLEVNLLIQTIINPQKNIYRHAEMEGVCVSAMITIPIYKLGSEAADDQSQIGCLDLNTDEPRDHIMVHNFGQIETDIKLQQATVEGHYKIELEG